MSNFWRILISGIFLGVLPLGCGHSSKKPVSRTHVDLQKQDKSIQRHDEKETRDISVSPNILSLSQQIVYVAEDGGARSFSHVGVLKELDRNNIEVSAYIGTGYAALIVALYLDSANINEFEWKILKLKNEVLTDALLNRNPDPYHDRRLVSALSNYLSEVFSKKTKKDLKKPLVIGHIDSQGVFVSYSPHEQIKDQILNSFSKKGKAHQREMSLVHFARRLNLGPTFYVNTMPKDVHGFFSDHVLRVKMDGVSFTDFLKINSAAYLGEREAKEPLVELAKKMSLRL